MQKSKGFDFTIATIPVIDNININQEMTYIRIALLYADKINIISPVAHVYMQFTDRKHFKNELQAIKLMDKLKPYVLLEEGGKELYSPIDEFKAYIRMPGYKMLPKEKRNQMKSILNEFVEKINLVVTNLLGANNIRDLKLLANNKSVNVLDFKKQLVETDDFVQEFLFKMFDSLGNSYPLFDKECTNLISLAIEAGVIKVSNLEKKRSVHAGLAQNLMVRLPSFEFAPVDEILDIRKSLNKPLIRFRAKMVNFSSEIKSIPGDSDFDAECDELYIKEVSPALLELEEHFTDTSFCANLGKRFLNVDLKTMGSLCFALISAGSIASATGFIAANTSLLAGGGVWATQQAAQAYYEYCRGKVDASRKELYFYHQVGKKLE